MNPSPLRTEERRSLALMFLIFLFLVIGIALSGYVSFMNYERQYRTQVDNQLSAIAQLKVKTIIKWRDERMGDAELLRRSPAFAALTQSYFENPTDQQSKQMLQAWLDGLFIAYEYDRVSLLDANGVERLAAPGTAEILPSHLVNDATAVLKSGQVMFTDFHQDETQSKIHLALLIPIYEEMNIRKPLGVVALRINPETTLYPYLKEWPVSSETAETLLVRLDGDSVLFLNSVRFQPDSALNLRIPLDRTDILAVKVATGQSGVVEGRDYRNVEMIGAVQPVPGTPWFLVARMDKSEVYAPLQARLWQTILFFSVMAIASGSALLLLWRQQRLRYYHEQMETLDALRLSEEKFKLAFETSPDAISITRLSDGTFISVNEGFEQITGYSRHEVIGRTSTEINLWKDPRDRQNVAKEIKAMGKVQNYGAPFLTKNGEIYGLMSAAIIQLDGMPHILNIMRDITARKQAEQALEQSELRFRMAVIDAPFPIMIHAEDGKVELVNKEWIRVTGYSPDDIPTIADWTEKAYGNRMERVREDIEKLYSITDKVDEGEYTITTINGEKRNWYFSSSPLGRTTDGRRIAMSMALDITERRLAEERLSEYADHLEEMVDERTLKLRETQEQLVRQERLATLGQLAGSIGHELRNPLGVISNAVFFLKMAQPDASEQIREYLDIIEKETQASDKIIADLLDFTRIKSIDRQPASVSDLVAQTLNRHPAPPSVHVTRNIPPGLPSVFADPTQVVQVLGNLVTNAYQAMPDGGNMNLSAHAHGDMIAVTVQDTGIGIPPDHLKKLFEPLFTTKTTGIGLGLAVSQKLAEANGGRIEVQSEPGNGSTFTLFLPTETQYEESAGSEESN